MSKRQLLPVTDLTRRVATRLRVLVAVRDMTKAEVSRKAGISQTIGNNIFRGVRSPTLDELQAICRELGVSVLDVVLDDAR